MASKRDLVEAYSYNRRRLVTAFVSGAPGGREVEPSRPGKAIFSGVVLAALVVGAGALAGEIEPKVKDGWDENSLVISKETGARYVAINKTLYPVLNTASARLALPPAEYKVVTVPQDEINDSKIGLPFGLPNAPDEIPDVENLIQTGWTSCVRTEHVERTSVNGQEQQRPVPIGTSMLLRKGELTATYVPENQAIVVRAGDAKYVLTNSRAYPANDQALSALGLATDTPLKVAPGWVAQFNAGEPLRPLSAPAGRAPLAAASGLAGYNDGDLLTLKGTQTSFLATPAGAFPMSPVRAGLYRTANPNRAKQINTPPTKLAEGTPPAALSQTTLWPDAVPTPLDVKGGAACVILDAEEGKFASTRLALPLEDYLKTTPAGSKVVAPGGGALVRTSPTTPVYLIDGLGRLYQLAGNGEQVSFGYGAVQPVLVPEGWLKAFGAPVVIDRNGLTGQTT